ncbi:hypothetical protein V498_07876 [Pseudogymnoascus sp. VKM F-4517 (FW-2822)]|nr:hypothetical protein V498_07876 [Pseudogymnoascus sp. VKM F-4517 (FW-2822)]
MTMACQPIPKYHIAPNFSIPPVEAGGTLELGSIIGNIASTDEEPLNLDCGELSWAPERSAEDVYHFRCIDTIYFSPSQEYMKESMGQPDVKDYVVGSDYKPVFMVTGLKTVRGPSVKMSKGRKEKVKVEVGLQQSGGVPLEVRPKFNSEKEVRHEMGFEDSTDFIIGIRVKKLMYKKHWLTRAAGTLVAKDHNQRATMVDDNVVEGGDEVVDLGDDTEGQIELETDEIDGETFKIAWVVSAEQ